jgi:hypothetical protein
LNNLGKNMRRVPSQSRLFLIGTLSISILLTACASTFSGDTIDYKSAGEKKGPNLAFPPDMTVTGGTYDVNTGIAAFTNNSGGTFNVTGFVSGLSGWVPSTGDALSGTLAGAVKNLWVVLCDMRAAIFDRWDDVSIDEIDNFFDTNARKKE